jgi:hypothetical protein
VSEHRDEGPRPPRPANDNEAPTLSRVDVLIPRDLPIQQVEIEVFAELLDSLVPANDNN